jgi:hypothetical protein
VSHPPHQNSLADKMALHTYKKKSFLFIKAICFICMLSFSFFASAQSSKKVLKEAKPNTKEFVISYAIVVKGDKINDIAETYNGGLKTAFVKNDIVRLRLVSLMRMQSIFYNNKKGLTKKNATILKESGKDRLKMYLNAKEWKKFNAKYDGLRCDVFKEDTVRILDKLCSKAIITTKDSTTLTAYFLPNLKSKALAAAEPLFAQIPGLVMKYIYTKGNKSIEYTATSLKFAPIAASVFSIPNKDLVTIKYVPGATENIAANLNDDGSEDDATEEEETEMTPAGTPATTPKPDSLKAIVPIPDSLKVAPPANPK